MNINKEIKNFLNVINSVKIDWTINNIYNWLQFNWEFFVEEKLGDNIVLEIYGEGADCGEKSRICYQDLLPTHKVVIKSKKNQLYDYLNNEYVNASIEYDFEEFVFYKDWYYIKAPFNFVLCYDKNKERIFSIDDCNFFVNKIEEK